MAVKIGFTMESGTPCIDFAPSVSFLGNLISIVLVQLNKTFFTLFSPICSARASLRVLAVRIRRVKLLLNRQTGEAVAMKMVDTRKHPDASASVKKECCIQKFLQHTYVLRFFGTRRQNDIEYIFLEYAAGGELFDRIGLC